MSDKDRSEDSTQYWDKAASSFDDEPDHGLQEPLILETWTDFLRGLLPDTRAAILDIGCGTGSLSVVLARLGHQVTGIDLSAAMIAIAQAKAARLNLPVEFHVMDASAPRLPGGHYDAIVCRHLLWTLPEPKEALQRWVELLNANGRLILIEGFWDTGAGLPAKKLMEILPESFTKVSLQNLSEHSNFWGKDVRDERYAIIADKTP